MTRFGLTEATAVVLALALAAPAMADSGHHVKGAIRSAVPYSDAYAYAEPRLPVQNALRWVTAKDTAITPRAGVVSTEMVATPAMSFPTTTHDGKFSPLPAVDVGSRGHWIAWRS